MDMTHMTINHSIWGYPHFSRLFFTPFSIPIPTENGRRGRPVSTLGSCWRSIPSVTYRGQILDWFWGNFLQETPIFLMRKTHGFGVRSSLESSDLCHFEASYWHPILGSPLLIFFFSHIELDTWGWNTTRFLWRVKQVGTIAIDPNWIPVTPGHGPKYQVLEDTLW